MLKVKSLFSSKYSAELNRTQLKNKAVKALEKKYDFLGFIGTGAYGDIIALWSKQDRNSVAAKVIDPNKTSIGEVKLWPRLKHRNIVPVLKIKRRQSVDIFLMPHYTKTLVHILEDDNHRRSPDSFHIVTEWMTDVLCGLEYMHSLDICHLDLKADNIMITSLNTAAIADFSSIEEARNPTDGYALPRYYCPPEAWPLMIRGTRPKVDGKAFDIWSYGMLCLYCFSDRYIESYLWGQNSWWRDIFPLMSKCFQCKLFYQQLCNAFPFNFPRIDSARCAYSLNLIKGVLRYRPEDRPNPTVILRHIILCKDGKDLLEPDIIWTYRKEEIQLMLLEDKVKRIISEATLIVSKEKELHEMTDKQRKGPQAYEIPHDEPVLPMKEYFCCCCRNHEDSEKG